MKTQAKYKNFACYRMIFSLQLVFVFSLFDLASASIISSHIITESSIILVKYSPFSQLHAARFQT